MTTDETSGAQTADLLSALKQRRTETTAAAAAEHASDAAVYWQAAEHLAGLRDDAHGVEAVDRALQRFQLGPDALAGDADALRRLAALRSHDIEQARTALSTARELLDERLQEAAEHRAKADLLETEARRDMAAAEQNHARAEQCHRTADTLAQRLRERGAPVGAEQPAPPPPPRPIRRMRVLQDAFINGRPAKAGDFITTDALEREGVLEVAPEEESKAEPVPALEGPRLSPTDDRETLSNLPWCGPGYAARQLAEQQRAAESAMEQSTGEPR